MPDNTMNMKPYISVIIPMYNASEYIRCAISSVLIQNYLNFEVIVVDDGSTDNSGMIVESIKDSRIRLIRQNNAGVSSARNSGITEAKGEYIAFLDSDDKWDQMFLEVIVELINLYPDAGIYSTGFRMIFSKGHNVAVTIHELHNKTSQLVYDYFGKSARSAFIHTSGIVISRHIFLELGMFLIDAAHGEDLEMWARIALRYPIAYDSRILFNFYQTGTGGKPRFAKFIAVDPVLNMLSNYIININPKLSKYKCIKYYMKHYFSRICLQPIRMNDRDATINYIAHNNMNFHGISATMIKKMPFIWFALRFFAWWMKVAHSRIMLRIRNGYNISHEIIQ